ncbi:hypothetical protein [Alteromonas gilva]|uniref:Uncharacterized protein n=1 Tax=Alteromonas gilva TaxID=2987522 RepID=A0ABT5KX19_9ALTE|nr:hypothetical protein [Alteromonas gilva]MDC8829183.1 hypothetical protein [Alteromonas gilva]
MNKKKNTVLQLWMLPLLFVVGCFAVNYATGALDYRNISSESSQRDFNAALGMPLVIGYLWVSLRIMHRRAANGMAEFLVKINQVSAFERHIRVLEVKLVKHVILALALAISVTLVYLITEDLLAFNQPLSVLVLNMMAVPFWFLIFLFTVQSACFPRYLYRHLLRPNISDVSAICHCKLIYDLGMNNTILCLMMFALFPVFWFGKTIPIIDIIILFVVFAALTILLFLPVIRMILLMKRHCRENIYALELRIRERVVAGQSDQNINDLSDQLNRLNQLDDDLKHIHYWPGDLLANLQILLLTIGIPVVCLLLAWVIT